MRVTAIKKVSFALVALLCFSVGFAAQPLPRGAAQRGPIPPVYNDVPIGHWAEDALRMLTELGILTGYPDGSFRGQQATTRFETALVAARIVDYVQDVARLLSQEILARQIETDAADPAFIDRMARLERALDNATSLAYSQRLEMRIARLETQMAALLAGTPIEDIPGMAAVDMNVPMTATEAADAAAEAGVTVIVGTDSEDAVEVVTAPETEATVTEVATEAVDAPTVTDVSSRDGNFYAAASVGLDFLGDAEFGVGAYFGFRDLIADNLDLQAKLSFNFGDFDLVTFAATAIYNVNINNSRITPYVGSGLRLFIGDNIPTRSGASLGFGFVGGADYRLTSSFSVFGEFTTDITVVGSSFSGVALGVKYVF